MSEKGCIKCGSRETGTKEVAMTGTGLSKMFDLQHNTFTVVFCKNCGYSEFYNKKHRQLQILLTYSSVDNKV